MVTARVAEHQLLRVVAGLEADGVAGVTGYRSTRRLLEDLWHLDPARAKRLLTQAELLCPRRSLCGEVMAAVLPATAAAHEQGLVEDGHLRVIATTLDQLARIPHLDPGVFAEAEAVLAEHAAVLAPRGLEKVARRLLARVDPDGAAPPEEPEPADEVQLLRRRDGRLVGTIDIRGRAEAELVVEVFDRLAAPAGPDDPRCPAQRRAEAFLDLCAQAASPTGIAAPDEAPDSARAPATDPEPPQDGPGDDTGLNDTGLDDTGPDDTGPGDTGPDDTRLGDHGGDDAGLDDAGFGCCPWPQADAEPGGEPDGGHGRVPPAPAGLGARDAVTETDTGAAETRRSREPRCPSVPVLGRALLALTIDHQWLQKEIGHGLLDSEYAVDPASARRLACDAAIVPMVLGSRSEPLDVGRLRYTIPDGLRRALHVRDGGCSFPSCTRRPKRCHAHHIVAWIDGGQTCLANTTLLCRYHHYLIHHGDWAIAMIGARPVYTPPTWIDPRQRPRPGGRTPLVE